MDRHEEARSFDSKYIKYRNKIEASRKRFLNTEDIEKILPNLAYQFTEVSEMQVGHTSSSKRMLVFGKDSNGNDMKNARQQVGVNFGPHVKCPYTDIQLIAIYHESDKDYASRLPGFFRNGNYKPREGEERKKLEKYIGTNVSYAADPALHYRIQGQVQSCCRNNQCPQ